MVNSLSDKTNPQSITGSGASPAPHSYSEILEKHFPYYLYCGMTYEQYWDGDPQLAVYYRKADEIRQDRENTQAWLQGMYIYDLISRLVPVMGAFPKKGAKPKPYVEQPYDLHPQKEVNAETQKQAEEKKTAMKGLSYMQKFADAFNRTQKEGGGHE